MTTLRTLLLVRLCMLALFIPFNASCAIIIGRRPTGKYEGSIDHRRNGDEAERYASLSLAREVEKASLVCIVAWLTVFDDEYF